MIPITSLYLFRKLNTFLLQKDGVVVVVNSRPPSRFNRCVFIARSKVHHELPAKVRSAKSFFLVLNPRTPFASTIFLDVVDVVRTLSSAIYYIHTWPLHRSSD